MIINDRVYGKTKITEPVLIELIKSKSMQRLKKISQYGLPDEYYSQRVKNYTRYEHSVGVMILLTKLGASKEEQVAGLLHDVSHTAFSHLIDWIISDKHHLQESYQDKQHKNFINKSKDLSLILKRYNYSPEKIFDYKKFSLLEQKLPQLCADRVDYALREFPKSISKKCIKELEVRNNKIVFKNSKSAYLFGINFLERQKNNWGSFEANARYKIFSEAFRYALDKKIILFSDFWEYDAFVINKLIKSNDKKILNTLKILRKKSLNKLPMSKDYAKRKFRRVDPLIYENNKLVRLSKVNSSFKNLLAKAKADNLKGTLIPLLHL